MFNTYLSMPYSCILSPQALCLGIKDDMVIEELTILTGWVENIALHLSEPLKKKKEMAMVTWCSDRPPGSSYELG